jgi:protein TonB
MATAMMIAPYYRHYDLPWTPSEETEQRFRITLRNALIAFAVVGLIFPFIPLPDRKPAPPALPDRVVQLLVEKKAPPPPPPPPKEEEKPKPVEAEKPKPEPKPEPKPKVEPPKDDARQRAQKALADLDLSAFNNNAAIDKAQQARNLSAAVGEQTRSERAMLTSKVGAGSGGINNAALSRGYGGSTGALKDQGTTQVSSSLGVGTGQGEARRTGASGKGARSREEVELEFDRNKGAIYQIYTRALRENPDLKGKVVLEITIAPSGQVTDCKVISSELNDPELERRLVARVKTFRFSARDVESLTLTKPIDFFPAG